MEDGQGSKNFKTWWFHFKGREVAFYRLLVVYSQSQVIDFLRQDFLKSVIKSIEKHFKIMLHKTWFWRLFLTYGPLRQAWGSAPERSLLKPFAPSLPQDDRHAVELANFHPFATFPPFFALLSLTTIGSGFQDTRMYNFGSYLLQVRCDMLWWWW